MNEIEQLKARIDSSAVKGIETAVIRDDYKPSGDMMISRLAWSGEYVARKIMHHGFAKWTIFKRGMEPY